MMDFLEFREATKNKWPNWEALSTRKNICITEEIEKNINNTLNILKKSRVCLIIGAEGRGKTVFARLVAYNYLENDKYKNKRNQVWQLDISDYGYEDRIEISLNKLRTANKWKKSILVIIENIHATPSDELLAKIFNTALKETTNINFLFTTRRKDLENIPEVIIRKGLYLNIELSKETIVQFIEYYKKNHNINKYKVSSKAEITKWIKNEISSNLRRLNWYLETWAKENFKEIALHESNSNKILHYVWEQIIKPLGNFDLQRALFKVSVINSYDIKILGAALQEIESSLDELYKRGILYENKGFYELAHSTDANYISRAFAQRKSLDMTKEKYEVIKKYLISGPPNFYKVINSLYFEEEKETLNKLLSRDIFTVIKEVARNSVDFKYIAPLLYKINWVNDKKAKELWSFYRKKFGNKIVDQRESLLKMLKSENFSLIDTFLFISVLGKLSRQEADYYKHNLGGNTIAEKSEYVSFNSIYVFALNQRKISSWENAWKLIKLLDPKLLGEKAKESHIIKIMITFRWFLKERSEGQNFANSFLKAIGKRTLVNKILPHNVMFALNRFFPDISKIDSNYASDLKKECYLSLDKKSKKEIWLYVSLRKLQKKLKNCFLEGIAKHLMKEVVSDLRFVDLDDRIISLYRNSKIEPLKILGRFLFYSYWINAEASEQIASKIVNKIQIYRSDLLKEFSLLCSVLRKIGNIKALNYLLNEISSRIDLISLIKVPFDEGLARLIKELNMNPQTVNYSIMLKNKITKEINFKDFFEKSEPQAICILMWNLWQVNLKKNLNWFNFNKDLWVEKLKSSSPLEAFELLCCLYKIKQDFAIEVANIVRPIILNNISELNEKNLAILGFFYYIKLSFTTSFELPNIEEFANKSILGLPNIRNLFLYVFFFKKKGTKKLINYTNEITKYLYWRWPTFSIEEFPNEFFFPETKTIFEKFYNKFEIFKQMIIIFKKFIGQEKSINLFIPIKDLLEFFCSEPKNRHLFENKAMAAEWLNLAIEQKIFLPDVTRMKMRLNETNPLVCSI